MRWCASFAALLLVSLPALAVDVQVEKDKVTFREKPDGQVIAVYHTAKKYAKPFFWPLNAPSGKAVTRKVKEDEKDHVHQRSGWFTHGDVIPGIEYKKHIKGVDGIDFWSERKGAGKIVATKVELVKGETAVATSNEWQTAEGQKILDETRTIRFSKVQDGYLLVVDIELTAVVPITFGDTKEGCFGVRVAESMQQNKGKGKLTNAEGKTGEKEVWGRKSVWNDYSGPIEGGKVAGIAIFQSPKNKVDAVWHSRNYGLMAANLFGREKRSKFPGRKGNNELVKLKKGEKLSLRFAIYLHDGDVKAGKVAEAYKDFVGLK